MQYDVYIDELFMNNFFSDCIILWLTGTCLREKKNYKRICIAGIIGGAYACVHIVATKINPVLKDIFEYLVISTVMVRISYGSDSIFNIAKKVAMLWLVSSLSTAVLIYLYYNTFIGYSIRQRYKGSMLVIYIFVAISFVITDFLMREYGDNREIKICSVEITDAGGTIVTRGLVDTGNSLRDAATKRAVSICEYEILKPVLAEGIRQVIDSYLCDGIMEVDKLNEEERKKVTFVLYNSVGQESGMMIALRVNSMLITDGGVIAVESPIVGVYNKKLSTRGEFSIILHPELLKY